MDDSSLDFDTLAAHAGTRERVGDTISTVAPITASTTFTYEAIEDVHAALMPEPRGFAYSRNANPTVVALETAIAQLEGADGAIGFGSGMAALHGALLGAGLQSGDTVVAAADCYGVTRSLLRDLERFGVGTRWVDILDLAAVDRALGESAARVLLFETISNPLLKVADIGELARLARQRGAVSIVDNTFATPVLVRPLQLGVDVVAHSATKYLAGHGDVVAGLVATNGERVRSVRDRRTYEGGVLSPFEAWLTMRGVRTLPLRVRRQCQNASHVAQWLAGRPWVRLVHYPGLPQHGQRSLAHQQFDGLFGAMIAFELDAGRPEALAFLDALRLITPGTSLGDVESLILYPALTSHRGMDDEQLRALGIAPALLRLSVGIESPVDLERDLEGAANAAGLLREVSGARGATRAG